MERIRLPEEGRDVVRSLKMTEQEYHRWKELFYKKEEKFFEMLAGEQEKEGLLLSLYVRFATDLYKAYVEKEIPDEVYDATFSDFTIWYRHCVKERKKIGLCEEQWLKLHLKMKLFRLGRLQFEPDEGQKVIHVHECANYIVVKCSNKKKGAEAKKQCNVSCIGCGICEKTCTAGAIKVKDNCAVIEESICLSCGMCAVKCPRHVIHDLHGILTEIR